MMIATILLDAAPAAAAAANSIDATAIVHDGASWVLTLIGAVAYAEFRKVVKDKAAQEAVLTAIEHGVSFGMNTVDGALKGKPLTVDVASPVAAQAIRYALAAVPDAAKRLGLDEAKLARMAVANLPGVDGQMDQGEINAIAAAASGKAPPGAPDVTGLAAALVPALMPVLEDAISARLKAATVPSPAPGQPQGSGVGAAVVSAP